MHRFVVTVGGEPPAAVEQYLGQADADELSYAPTGHLAWRSADGLVRVVGWHTGDADHGTHGDGGLTMWGGNVRILGSHGRPTASALRDVVRINEADPRHRLRDAYALVDLDADGCGIAFGDALALHPLYVAQPAPGVTVIGNRSALVAEVDARWRGTTPTRSIETAQWMAFAGYVVGDGTGFDGVSRLPQGALMEIYEGRATTTLARPLYAGEPDDRLDVETFADAFEHEIVDALRHTLALTDRPELELTAGKDSRLNFAVAHRAGILSDFAVTTYGPPDLLDVQIAGELCAVAGVPHNHIRNRKPADAVTYRSIDRIRRHVHRTCGVSQIGEAVEPTPSGSVYVSGLFGEYFRTDHRGEARNPATSVEEAAERFPIQRRFGSAGVLHPDVHRRLTDAALAHMVAPGDEARDPADLRAVFTTRFRFPAWQNPLIDRNMNAIHPLASDALVRQAFRVAPEARHLELPHRIIMERADPRIARHRFGNTQWRKPKPKPRPKPKPKPKPPPPPRPAPLPPSVNRLRRAVPFPVRRALRPLWAIIQKRRTPKPTPAPPAPPPHITDIESTPAVEGLSSVRKTRDWLPVSRRDLVALLESDRDNPVFEFVDFETLLDLVSGEGPGDPLADLQVNGTITAFLWLGAHELPSRTDG